MAKVPKSRRSHRKSRNGCRECKQRHVMCDENHPSCVNCSTAGCRCSYLDEFAAADANADADASANASVSASASATPSALSCGSTTSLLMGTAADAEDNGVDCNHEPLDFSLGHLALLHHLEHYMAKSPGSQLFPDEKHSGSFLETIFRAAVSAQYLIDELLAFSALHLSTLAPDVSARERYSRQASQLQTRALMRFNSSRQEVGDGNCMAMFLFSSLLGMHIFFDAFVSRSEPTQVIDKLVQYFNIHRGVRCITQQAWRSILQTEVCVIVGQFERLDQAKSQQERADEDLDKLGSLFAAAEHHLSTTSLQACREAVESLRWALGQHKALPWPYSIHVILSWPVKASIEYVELLRQRCPEALLILAHWAVLLHYGREFWLFNDAGRFLVESISGYLGSYWDEWMEWPKGMVNVA